MTILIKRFGAYIIDYLLVSIIIYGIMLLPFVNPSNEEYQTKYNELFNISEEYAKKEINKEEYDAAFVPIAYQLYRLNINYVVVSSICFIVYFGIVQFYFQGKTVGKRLLKFSVTSNDGKKLTMVNYILRAIILYNILIPIIELIIVYTMKVDNYLPVYQKVNMVGYIIMYINIFVMLVKPDGRGIHDLVANTKVIYNETEPNWHPWTKIIEVKSKEKKETSDKPKAKVSTKTKQTTTKSIKKEPKKTKPNKK